MLEGEELMGAVAALAQADQVGAADGPVYGTQVGERPVRLGRPQRVGRAGQRGHHRRIGALARLRSGCRLPGDDLIMPGMADCTICGPLVETARPVVRTGASAGRRRRSTCHDDVHGYSPQEPRSRWKYRALAQRHSRIPTLTPTMVTTAGR